MKNSNNHTLAHTTWNCKDPIVFTPKFCRKVFYGEKHGALGQRDVARGLHQYLETWQVKLWLL